MGKKIRDPLGYKMKRFEMEEAGRRMMPGLPIMARLDGRAFHTFTRGLERPYDTRFMTCMIETTKALVDEFQASLGYTQSDEITLFWDHQNEMLFDGRYQKWVSLLAAAAAENFIWNLIDHLPEKTRLDARGRRPRAKFDCRVWQLPTSHEVTEAFQWREDDATRNSLQMLAQAHYSSKELHRKSTAEQHDLLHAKGINWNDEPASFKRGTYVKRVVEDRTLSPKELAAIPEKHRPTGPVTRSRVVTLDAKPLSHYQSIYLLATQAEPRARDLD